MYYVYILKSTIKDVLYIGSSENPERRLLEHNGRLTKSTKAYAPWKIVFKQNCDDRITARRVEFQLKKKKSKIILEQIIKDGYIRAISSAG